MQFKLLLPISFFILIASYAKSQDTIYRKDNTTIRAKEILINENEIEYKRFDDASGIIRTISLSEVDKIKYENGQEKKIKSAKGKEMIIDKNSLWNNNSTSNINSSSEKKEKKETIEKNIVTIGPRYQSLKNHASSHISIGAWGGGFGISTPVGKRTKSITYKISALYGSEEIQNDYPTTLGQGEIYLLSEESQTFVFKNFVTWDWRIKISNKSFFAPAIGLAMNLSTSSYEDYFVYEKYLNGNYVRDIYYDSDEPFLFDLGLVIGFDLILKPIGVEIKYDTPDNSLLFGINAAF
ncbi:MAG: hypothetical protein IPP27_02270 [Bacteroidetes bacterium]|nr:hypothetical protein [Bacteroidota bacterium]